MTKEYLFQKNIHQKKVLEHIILKSSMNYCVTNELIYLQLVLLSLNKKFHCSLQHILKKFKIEKSLASPQSSQTSKAHCIWKGNRKDLEWIWIDWKESWIILKWLGIKLLEFPIGSVVTTHQSPARASPSFFQAGPSFKKKCKNCWIYGIQTPPQKYTKNVKYAFQS